VARELLPEELRSRGAHVDVVPVYRTILPNGAGEEWRRRLADGEIHVVTFTSSSTVRNFVEMFGGIDRLKPLMQRVVIACIGPITARTAEEQGLTVSIVPGENTVPALVQAIAHYYGSREQVATGA
jgi:uroporphyrinogen III methyltransferase/synthase